MYQTTIDLYLIKLYWSYDVHFSHRAYYERLSPRHTVKTRNIFDTWRSNYGTWYDNRCGLFKNRQRVQYQRFKTLNLRNRTQSLWQMTRTIGRQKTISFQKPETDHQLIIIFVFTRRVMLKLHVFQININYTLCYFITQ